MKTIERKKVQKEVYTTDVCGEEINIDELKAILNEGQEKHGAETMEIWESSTHIGCGEYESDGFKISFYKYELETDAVYNRRVEAILKREKEEREKEEREIVRKEKYRLEQIEAEKNKLRELMEKYPEIAK